MTATFLYSFVYQVNDRFPPISALSRRRRCFGGLHAMMLDRTKALNSAARTPFRRFCLLPCCSLHRETTKEVLVNSIE